MTSYTRSLSLQKQKREELCDVLGSDFLGMTARAVNKSTDRQVGLYKTQSLCSIKDTLKSGKAAYRMGENIPNLMSGKGLNIHNVYGTPTIQQHKTTDISV